MRRIPLFFKRLYRKIKAYLFIHNIGTLPVQFDRLIEPLERASFAQDHFGKDWRRVLNEYLDRKDINESSDTLPALRLFVWRSDGHIVFALAEDEVQARELISVDKDVFVREFVKGAKLDVYDQPVYFSEGLYNE